MTAAVAMLSPQTAPKAAHEPTVAMARPPRRCPSQFLNVPNAAAMVPPSPATIPMAMKSGMTTRIGEELTS